MNGPRKIFVDQLPVTERAIWAVPVAMVMILATLWPLTWHPRDDDFPLSTYPMFSGRANSEVQIPHVITVGSSGDRSVVSNKYLSGGEVMQAFESLRIIIGSAEATAELCQEVANRLPGDQTADAEVQIVTDTFDALKYFENDRSPVKTVVHTRCRAGQ